MCIILTSNSLIKTKTKKEIFLGLFQNLKGNVTVETYIFIKSNLEVKKIPKLKLKIQEIPIITINIHEAIGTSIFANAPPR